jgi:hypothetical protein
MKMDSVSAEVTLSIVRDQGLLQSRSLWRESLPSKKIAQALRPHAGPVPPRGVSASTEDR